MKGVRHLFPWAGHTHAAARRGLQALAIRCYGWPARTAILVLLLGALAGFGVRELQFSADLARLLPNSFESVQDLDSLKERFGGIGYVVVAAWNTDPQTLRRFADDMAPALEAIHDIRYVEYKRPIKFLEERALYYLDAETLEEMYQRLRERWKWEKRSSNPMYINLEDDAPAPEVDFSDLLSAEDEEAGTAWFRTQTGEYYLSEERKMVALLAKPSSMSSDLRYARQVVDKVQALVDGVDRSAYDSGMQLGITGRYKKMLDREDRLRADLGLASLVAMGLMLLYLLVHFRSFVSVLLVVTPLAVGLWWTFGLAGVMFESLNILTGFLGAILLGLGIDHGIHLLERYGSERVAGRDVPEALRITYKSTGLGVAAAAMTTVVAFATLAISEFRAFREFGIMAATGMWLIVVAYGLCLPPLVRLVERHGWRSSKETAEAGGRSLFAAALPRWAPLLFWGGGLLSLLLVSRLPDTRFNYDFASLEGSELPSFVLDSDVNALLGYSQTPVVVLADSDMEARAVATLMRARREGLGNSSTVDFVATFEDLIPTNQAAKKERLKRIDKLLGKLGGKRFTGEEGRDLRRLRQMSRAEPFARADLPDELRRQFQGPDGRTDDGFVLAFPSISLSDGEAVSLFATEVRGLELPSGKRVSAAGEAMILADILSMVKREGPPVLTLAMGAVLLACWLLMGSLKRAALSLLPAAVTLITLLGLVATAGMELNYMNIIVLPVLLGIGVDGAVHLVLRGTETTHSGGALGETGRAIAGANLTTALGFGALLLADHPGLDSLGSLAVVGLSVNLLVTLVALPALLSMTVGGGRESMVGGASRWLRLARSLSEQVATVGKAGYSPIAPGTVGALLALPLAYVLSDSGWELRICVTLAIIAGGWWASRRFSADRHENDPQEVVVDELAGTTVALLFVPFQPLWAALTFGLFRLFDIWKPGPVGWADRRLHGGLGIMADDLLAGLMAGVAALGLHWLSVYTGLFSGG